mmetsp:Transcript_18652/g.31858  ORF Transcript_18652/g.31858 Transcript_18652/m.31858 type:complete len:258 (-) Transcript_18652:341-1114(-)
MQFFSIVIVVIVHVIPRVSTSTSTSTAIITIQWITFFGSIIGCHIPFGSFFFHTDTSFSFHFLDFFWCLFSITSFGTMFGSSSFSFGTTSLSRPIIGCWRRRSRGRCRYWCILSFTTSFFFGQQFFRTGLDLRQDRQFFHCSSSCFGQDRCHQIGHGHVRDSIRSNGRHARNETRIAGCQRSRHFLKDHKTMFPLHLQWQDILQILDVVIDRIDKGKGHLGLLLEQLVHRLARGTIDRFGCPLEQQRTMILIETLGS